MIVMGTLFCVPFSYASSTADDYLDKIEAARTSSPDQAALLIKQFQSEFPVLSDHQNARLKFLQAYLLAFKGDIDAATTIALTIHRSEYPEIAVRANLLLASVNESRKRFGDAYTYLYDALARISEVNDPVVRSNVYTVAAQLHLSAAAYQKAAEFAHSIADGTTELRPLCISKVLSLKAYIMLEGSYKSADLQAAKLSCDAANEPLMKYQADLYASYVDVRTNPKKVFELTNALLPELKKIGFKYAILDAQYQKAFALLKLKRYDEAEKELQLVVAQAQQLQDHDIANKAVLHLAELAEQAGPQPQAVVLYKQHIAALNQHLTEYKERSIAYHLAQANYMENQNKLALLQQQNALLQLEAELQQQELLWTVLAGAASILVLLTAVWLLQRKQRQLFQLAHSDGLTGCLNRRRFSELAQQWLTQHPQQPVALLLFDLDLFKNINDRYGHSAGDAVLQALVSRLQPLVPAGGYLARLGGEEFAIWLSDASLAQAATLAEQCRAVLCNEPLHWQQQGIHISASFGVVSGPAPAELESLLQSADRLLYQAKTAGRNCCICQPLEAVA